MIVTEAGSVTASRTRSVASRWRGLAALLCAVVMALGIAPPAAAAGSQGLGYDLLQVPMGWTDLGQQILIFRREHPEISHRSNVAIFQFERSGVQVSVAAASVGSTGTHVRIGIFHNGAYNRDESETITVAEFERRYATNPINKHSEEIVYAYLDQPERERVTHGESELQPCLLPGHLCRTRLQRDWFNQLETMRYHDAYGEDRSQRRDAVDALERRLNRWARDGRPVDPLPLAALFTPPGQAPPLGGLVNALSGVPGQTHGGIDFSTLELRYLADPAPGSDQGFRFSFTADQVTSGDSEAGAGQVAAMQASDAFFVWLSLPRSTFWVNLHPHEPDRIVDPRLGTTDVGRILLEADLQMKRTVGELIHPDTDLGEQYWATVDSSSSCQSFRQWIVPAPATIREADGELYIFDAPLSVKLESEYVETGVGGMATADPCGGVSAEREEEIFRELVLPEVERAVNHAPEYAELRRVYLSRVAAEWYRQRSLETETTYAPLIDSGNVTPWPAIQEWSSREVFDEYVDSYTHGEFNVEREVREGDTIYTYVYVYGGVDLASVPFDNMDDARFQDEWRGLPDTVNRSLREVAVDPNSQTWLGAVSHPTVPDDWRAGPADSTTPVRRIAMLIAAAGALVIVVGVVVAILIVLRSGRPRRPTQG